MKAVVTRTLGLLKARLMDAWSLHCNATADRYRRRADAAFGVGDHESWRYWMAAERDARRAAYAWELRAKVARCAR